LEHQSTGRFEIFFVKKETVAGSIFWIWQKRQQFCWSVHIFVLPIKLQVLVWLHIKASELTGPVYLLCMPLILSSSS